MQWDDEEVSRRLDRCVGCVDAGIAVGLPQARCVKVAVWGVAFAYPTQRAAAAAAAANSFIAAACRYMTDAYHQISKIAADHKVPLRTAAFVLAVKRVADAEIHRGFD